jgi:glucose-1-phosphate thymidylyltransferase
MKGIILAGGSGSRLYPITLGVSKQLIPIGDKPMIYYPLSVLMLAGIKEILIISTTFDLPNFKRLLGNGSHLGIKLIYKEQLAPNGLADAFIIGEEFIGSDDVCLILGDNIFYGHDFSVVLEKSLKEVAKKKKAIVFGYYVNDPHRYGVIDFDDKGNALSIVEKPTKPKSNYAVVGLYFYPNNVIKLAKKVKPSKRGEIEITTINQSYLKNKNLRVELLGRGFAWLDTGTPESLLDASNFIQAVENRQGLKIACIEEIAFLKGYISKNKLIELSEPLKKSEYGKYLIKVSSEKKIPDVYENIITKD